jgi:hypothetical protein
LNKSALSNFLCNALCLYDLNLQADYSAATNASLTVENSNLIVDTAGATEQIELYSPLFERSTLVAPFLRMNFGFTDTS